MPVSVRGQKIRIGGIGALERRSIPQKQASMTGAPAMVRGAQAVAKQALNFARLSPFVRPALVNGGAGVVVAPGGQQHSVMGFTVRQGKIAEIDILADPQRLGRLDLTFLDE